MNKSILDRLLQSTIIGGMMFAGASYTAFAQTADQEAAPSVELIDEAEEDEFSDGGEVVVTGSRLRKNSFTSVSPLQVVDGETARDLGIVNAQDILSNTTVVTGQQNTVGLSTAFNGGLQQAFTTIGNATPSLRGLGSSVTGRSRSLVLVNGRRLGPIGVGGAPANADVSMIPGSLVERTEILLDGASSVYGSDAIAGVVNYIMRSDFDGVELAGQTSISEHGWGQSSVISATTGVSNDRGFMGFAVEYNIQDEIEAVDIYSDIFPLTQGQPCEAAVGEFLDGTRNAICSSYAAGFNINAGLGTIVGENPNGDLAPVPGVPGQFIRPGNFFRPGDDPIIHGFPQNSGDSFLPEIKRLSLFTTGEYDLGGGQEFFVEGMYSSRQLENQASTQEVLPYTADNAFNPFGAPGLLVYNTEFQIDQELDVTRLVAGFRGDLTAFSLPDSWSYEVFANSHRSVGSQVRSGFLQENRILAGLNSRVDPVTGQIVCDLPDSTTFFGLATVRSPANCVPLNPFEPEFLTTGRFPTDAQNDYAFGIGSVTTEVEQIIAGGFVTGDLFKLPQGGTSQLLLGVEARRDQVKTTPDDNSRLGLLQGLDADEGSNGNRWIKEAFGELSLPIFEDQPFAKSLLVEGALRYTQEEFAGDGWTYQVKGEYAPNDWLSFRGGYGTSFRAPDTGEQFGTGTVFVQTSRADPCLVSGFMIDRTNGVNTYDASLDTRSQILLDNCRSLGIDPTTAGSVNQGTPDLAFVTLPVAFGNFGDREVQPETSKAFFAGGTFDQPWFDSFDLSFTGTYYDYEVNGSIGQLTRGQILNDCFESLGLSDPLCRFQTRDTAGNLTSVNEASINLGAITSRGYDVNMRVGYELDQLNLDDSIELEWNLLYTQSLENTEDILGNAQLDPSDPNFEEADDLLGTLTFAGGFPDYSVVSTVRANYKDIGLTWRLRYLSDMVHPSINSTQSDLGPCFNPDLGGADPDCREAQFVDSQIENDLFATYANDSWTFRFGVTNLFDKVQQIDERIGLNNVCISCGHDIFGRRFTMGIQKRF